MVSRHADKGRGVFLTMISTALCAGYLLYGLGWPVVRFLCRDWTLYASKIRGRGNSTARVGGRRPDPDQRHAPTPHQVSSSLFATEYSAAQYETRLRNDADTDDPASGFSARSLSRRPNMHRSEKCIRLIAARGLKDLYSMQSIRSPRLLRDLAPTACHPHQEEP